MKTHRLQLFAMLMTVALLVPNATATAQPQADAEGRAIAESVMDAMGGQTAWYGTRHVSWNFFGSGRQHHWDKWTGDVRISSAEGQDREGSHVDSP